MSPGVSATLGAFGTGSVASAPGALKTAGGRAYYGAVAAVRAAGKRPLARVPGAAMPRVVARGGDETTTKGFGMGRLVLLVIGVALGVTAAVLISAYETRGPSREIPGPHA